MRTAEILSAHEWLSNEVLRVEGKADYLLPLPFKCRARFEVRAAEGAVLYAVSDDGEMLFLAEGQNVFVEQIFHGFAGVSIECAGPFRYKAVYWSQADQVDPVSTVVEDVLTQEDIQRDLIRKELMSVLANSGRIREAGLTLEDLLEEVEQDFEADFDDFPEGEGYMEPIDFGLEPNPEPTIVSEAPAEAAEARSGVEGGNPPSPKPTPPQPSKKPAKGAKASTPPPDAED